MIPGPYPGVSQSLSGGQRLRQGLHGGLSQGLSLSLSSRPDQPESPVLRPAAVACGAGDPHTPKTEGSHRAAPVLPQR